MSQPGRDKPQRQSTLEQRLDIVVADDNTADSQHPFLLLLSRSGVGQLFPLIEEECVIGRSSSAQISLDEPALSHKHARVTQRDGDWWLEDMGSTNGTFLNDKRVTGPARLRPSDVIRLGETRLLFLANASSAEHTIDLRKNSLTAPLLAGNVAEPPVAISPPQVHVADDLTRTSLPELLGQIGLAWRLFKRYAWLGLMCVCLGVAAGIIHTRLKPPAGSAWFEITLISEAKANPIDEEEGEPRKEAFFLAPENTFTSLPLIAKTLKKLGVPNPKEEAESLQGNLSMTQSGYRSQLWRGEYQAESADENPARLLETHLKFYLEKEIEQTLKVFKAEVDFYEHQLKEANKATNEAEQKLVEFREKHPNIMPGQSVPSHRGTLADKRAAAAGALAKTQMEIQRTQTKLERGDEILQKRLEAAGSYDTQIAEVNAKIAAARARGLAGEHPEIKALKQEASNLTKLRAKALTSKATDLERRANPEYRQLEDRLQKLKQEEAAARANASAVAKAVAGASKKEASVPQLEATYDELSGVIKQAQTHAEMLDNKLKERKLQLQLERASAEAHYNLITPPTNKEPSTEKTAMKRGAMGGIVGLLFACLVAGIVELRRYALRLQHA